jgi:hypothetical protein
MNAHGTGPPAKATAQKAELERCDAIREDMRLLGIRYGQIDP